MNIGILGFGRQVEKRIINVLTKSKKFNIVGFYTRNQNKAKSYRKKYQIKFLKSKKDLMNIKELDLIYISTPPFLHYEDILMCLKNKKNVICEKPLYLNFDQTKNLYKYAETNNLYLFEVCQYRFQLQYNKIINIISKDLKKNSKNRFLYSSLKIPLPEQSNFRLSSKFKNSALFDVGYYPVNFASNFVSSKNIVSSFFYNKKINFSGGCLFSSNKMTVFISWGMGEKYENQITYQSSNINFNSQYFYSKKNKQKTSINFYNSINKKIPFKYENFFENMFNYFYFIIKNKDKKKYKIYTKSTLLGINLLNSIAKRNA